MSATPSLLAFTGFQKANRPVTNTGSPLVSSAMRQRPATQTRPVARCCESGREKPYRRPAVTLRTQQGRRGCLEKSITPGVQECQPVIQVSGALAEVSCIGERDRVHETRKGPMTPRSEPAPHVPIKGTLF